MKEVLQQERALDKLVDEVVELIANSKKLTDVLKTVQESEAIQKRNSNEFSYLKNRIINLENRLNKLVKNFEIDVVEADRMITEKTEKILDINEQRITHLTGQIEDLRDMIVRIGNEVKKIKEPIKI